MITIHIDHIHIAAPATEIVAKLDQIIEAIGTTSALQAAVNALTERLKQQTTDLAATVAASPATT